MKNFLTDDGYLIHQVEKQGFVCWTDGDLSFEDEDDWPVDFMGKLDGRMVGETIVPMTHEDIKSHSESS